MSSNDKYVDIRKLSGSKEVYVIKEAGYFPVLTALSDCEVIAVLRSGAGHVGIGGRLDVVRSEDGGDSWSEPITVADSDRDDRNPALGIAKSGTIILAYHEQGSYDADGKFAPDRSIYLNFSENTTILWSRFISGKIHPPIIN